MSAIIIFAAYAFLVIGGILVLIEAFRESVLWGLGCMLIPVVSLIFVVGHWGAAKRGVLFQLLGLALLVVGLLLAPSGTHPLG